MIKTRFVLLGKYRIARAINENGAPYTMIEYLDGALAPLVAVLARDRSANDNVTPGDAPIHASVAPAGKEPRAAAEDLPPERARTEPASSAANDEILGSRQ